MQLPQLRFVEIEVLIALSQGATDSFPREFKNEMETSTDAWPAA
jgi:hypothetical protein